MRQIPMLGLHERAIGLLLLTWACLSVVVPRQADAAASQFSHAEHLRDALEARSQASRTPEEYQRVLAAYRAVYGTAQLADAAMDAVAGLLAEEGRVFHQRSLLLEAVGRYSYLRHHYPGSLFRQGALLSQAEIEAGDLHDKARAREDFTTFLKLYPRTPLAAEARQQLKALGRHDTPAPAPYQQAVPARESARNAVHPQDARAAAAEQNAQQHARELAEFNAIASTPEAHRGRSAAPPPTPIAAARNDAAPASQPVYITAIRHWSTPVYTRVAIDLTGEVQFEAARVPGISGSIPDRIYFDLHGARLAPLPPGARSAARIINVDDTLADDGYLRRVRTVPTTNGSRVVLDVSNVSEYSAFFLPNPWRLIVDIHASRGAVPIQPRAEAAAAPDGASLAAPLNAQPNRIRATRRPTTAPIAASVSGTTRAPQPAIRPNELEQLSMATAPPRAAATASSITTHGPVKTPGAHTVPVAPPANATPNPPLDATPDTGTARRARETLQTAAREALPTSTGERSLVRTLGLKVGRIVIDAGHGGHDSGTLGVDGIEEKDIVLDTALRLGKLLKQRLGADVIYTRDDDTFIPLETRTAIANKAQADLFISIHGNSSPDPSARGVEVYYLNFTTAPEALEVAARENAVSDQSIYQLSDLVKKITLKDKIDESHEFAADVEDSLYSGLEQGNAGLKDRGVKKAPFVVLIGANMPSILAEISFLTNPEDARQMRDPAYRQRIAESLYRGVARYSSGLSGVRLARNGGYPAEH